MDSRGRETEVSPAERTIPNDPERTLAAPRFDEKSVQRAVPAVPLRRRSLARSPSLPVILLCAAAGLVGGLVVAFALVLWQKNDNPRAQTPPAQQQPADAAASPSATTENPTATTQQEANADARGTRGGVQAQGDAQTPAAQTQGAKGSGDARTPDASAAALTPPKPDEEVAVGERVADAGARDELRSALGDWIAATNARDINRQMQFYAPTVAAFYLARNASRESVRAEKTRVFANAGTVDVRASAPEISLSRDGQTAVMRFRKRYQIGGDAARSGEVLQELRWRRTPAGWKIVSERDLRVLQ